MRHQCHLPDDGYLVKPTVLKLLADLGTACFAHNITTSMCAVYKSKRVQCDEIWSFVGAKMKNASAEKVEQRWGDAWTWTALDADSKAHGELSSWTARP